MGVFQPAIVDISASYGTPGDILTNSTVSSPTGNTKWLHPNQVPFPKSCQTGLGDGLNAIASGTYLQTFCYNDTGATWTITGIKCFTDNSGSTLNATDGSANALLTGAISCASTFAAGTQSAHVTIPAGGYVKFTFVADGTSTQSTWVVSFTQ
jgi:hypothetical protein